MTDRMRASDAEREETVAALRVAAGEGRLTVEELDERTSAAYAAVTRGDLARLLDDLPDDLTLAPRLEPPAPRRKRLPTLPGRADFAARWVIPEPPDVAAFELVQELGPPLRGFGYELVERTPGRIVFTRRRRPAWTFVVAVVFFPVGLLALLYTTDDRISVDLARSGRETVCLGQGVAPLAVRRALAQLEE